MDFVADTPPMIGEGLFCKEEVGREYELGRKCTARDVCQNERVSDLRRLEYLCRDVDYGGEDGHPIGVMRRWVAKNDMKNLDESELCPRVASHAVVWGLVKMEWEGESDRAPHENGTQYGAPLPALELER